MEELVITKRDTLSELISNAVRRELKIILPQKNPESEEKVYTNKQAMDYLHVSRSTLQRWRNDGKLPYRKVQGKILYTERDLNKLLEDAAMKHQESCSEA